MASENRIQLRHGTSVPQNGDLLPWELGICGDRLFIGLNQIDGAGKYVVKELTLNDKDGENGEGNQPVSTGVGMTGTGILSEIFNNISANRASGDYSHAEGTNTEAGGYASHAEGKNTRAEANESHAEGNSTLAQGYSSHAEGHTTTAGGQQSHAEGWGTVAEGKCTHVQGRFNKIDESDTGTYGKYAHIVGNGTSDQNRANIHTLDWNGNSWFAGEVFTGGEGQLDPAAKRVMASAKYRIKMFGGPYPNLTYGADWAEHNKYYGSCMVIHGGGKSFLFDTGAVRFTGVEISDKNTPLLKYIDENNVKKPLTALFISHFHSDHYAYETINYLWNYGYISGETLVVFPSATNGDSGNYNSQRGYLIHCLGKNTGTNPPTNKDPNNIFKYKTSAEPAIIHKGFSNITSLAGKETVINIDSDHSLFDGEILEFDDVTVECYNIDTKNKNGEFKYSGFGINTTNGKPMSGTATTSADSYYNNYSMINVVNIQGIKIVVTGDIAEMGQREYLDVLTKPAGLMIIPHHGLEAFIAPELFGRLCAKYGVEQSIYSPVWRKKVSNVYTAELARGGCCTLQTLYGDLVFEIENFQINRVAGERDAEVRQAGNTHLCPNAYCDCAIKYGQNIYELLPGEYITYDQEVAASVSYTIPSGFTNAGITKTPKLCTVDGHSHAFRVSVKNTTHLVYGAYQSFRQITITPLLFDSTCSGTLRQAIAVQTKGADEKCSWSDWRYLNMTTT